MITQHASTVFCLSMLLKTIWTRVAILLWNSLETVNDSQVIICVLDFIPFMPLWTEKLVNYTVIDCMDPGLLTDGQMT